MALPTNTFRPTRYLRSKFREGKFLLAAEATDLQLESFELLKEWIKQTYGDVNFGPAFRVDLVSVDELIVRPGEAWQEGIPFVMDSGSDRLVIPGTIDSALAINSSLFNTSASSSDVGGKTLKFTTLADGNYSVVIEAAEELVKDAGVGAVDPFLQGTNVGEGTEHKFRFVHKIHVVDTSDLDPNPTFPLSGAGIDNHFVNEIELTPVPNPGGKNFVISAAGITPDPNGADIEVTFDNSAGEIPFSTDSNDYIFGKLIDSDGNELTIASITTSDGGLTVTMRLDREVDVGSSSAVPDLPIINDTDQLPWKLVKRDHYVTNTNGDPVGKRYMEVSRFSVSGGNITSVTDQRVVSETNSFGVDPNVRMTGGGVISWNGTTGDLVYSSFFITVPGIAGAAEISSGVTAFPSNGKVAYVLLDRNATSNYTVSPIVVDKEDVPSNVNVYVFAERADDRIYFPHNGSIGDGETGILGAFGATLDKDASVDNIVDGLTENQMDEVFAETFDEETFVDLVNTVAMTFEPFQKQYKASAGSRFVNYEANVVPTSDPTDPWTRNSGFPAGNDTVTAGILSIIDNSVGALTKYERTEASLTSSSHSEHKFRSRIVSNGGEGGPYMIYLIDDGTKKFGIGIDDVSVSLVDANLSVLQTFALDGTTYHEFKLVKIGDKTIQWYTDEVFRGAYVYDDISTGSASAGKIEWGTRDPVTCELDVDFVRYNIYGSILQSLDLFRQGSVFYPGNTLPENDPDNPWTIEGGTLVPTFADSILTIVDNSGANRIAWERTESKLVRQGDAEIESRVKFSSLTSLTQFGCRIKDGTKDVAVYVRDDASQLKVGMYDGNSNTLVSNEFDIDTDEFVVIKLKKLTDVGYQLFIDDSIKDSNAYEEFTDSTADKKFEFGFFENSSQVTVEIDYVQYQLPGQGSMAATPVRDMLRVIGTDDPLPNMWVSTDDGKTWHEMLEGITTSIADLQVVGGNILARVGLSQVNSVLTDYGLYYHKTNFDVEGAFEYFRFTAVGGETVVTLPFTYTPSVNELIVHKRPFATSLTNKLTETLDYTEPNASQVEFTSPLAAGDVVEFRNSFVKDPLVPPPVRFVAHNHDGSRGEAEDINPRDIDATGDVTVAGTINGTSPLKLAHNNDGVIIGDGTLGAGNMDLELATDSGGTPRLQWTRGANNWRLRHSSSMEMKFNYNGIEQFSLDKDGNIIIPGDLSCNDIVCDTIDVADLVVSSSVSFPGGNIIRETITQDISADTTLNPGGVEDKDVLYLLSNSTGSHDMGLAAGSFVGQKVTVVHLNGTNDNLSFRDDGNGPAGSIELKQNGNIDLDEDDSAEWIWGGDFWYHIAESDNS